MATTGRPGSTPPFPPRRDATPCPWLAAHEAPELPLPPEARRGLQGLRRAVEPFVPFIVRGLVHLTSRPRRVAERLGAPASALNRRRRAATEWLRALLAGCHDAATLQSVGEQWLPTLTGAGHDPERVAAGARACIEYVRGALTALVFARPEDNLVPEARALYALESVLARHVAAVERARHTFGQRRAPSGQAATPV